jgi:alpha-galactosidase
MREKFVLIGAGSAVFTQGLLADMIRMGDAADVALVDVDPDALEVAERLARKMVSERDAPIHITASTDRRGVLRGATVVICTVGVGGRRAWEQDVFIPRRYGIYMPVGDTVGPGGTARSIRMIPAMVDIARDVVELAPDALFFNYSNPMAPVCRAIRIATGANVIGLCHGVFHVARYLADVLKVTSESLQYTAVGYNHLTWFTEIRSPRGDDLMPTLHDFAEQHLVAGLRKQASSEGVAPDDNLFSWQLFRLFKAFPAVLDRHVTEFFPQFFRAGSYYGRTLGIDAFSFEGTIRRGDEEYATMQEEAFSEKPLGEAYFRRLEGEHEQVMDIVSSIRQNRGHIYSANLPNRGQVPNLPPDVIVEGPARADANGLHPLPQSALPSALVGTLATRYMWVETVVEAALEGSRDKFVQALIIDGAVGSMDTAERLADELIAAHGAYLPWATERADP